MADVATMQAQLAALQQTMWSGHLRVQHHNRVITYQSTEEMRQAIADLQSQISAASGDRPKRAVRMRQSGRAY